MIETYENFILNFINQDCIYKIILVFFHLQIADCIEIMLNKVRRVNLCILKRPKVDENEVEARRSKRSTHFSGRAESRAERAPHPVPSTQYPAEATQQPLITSEPGKDQEGQEVAGSPTNCSGTLAWLPRRSPEPSSAGGSSPAEEMIS